VKDVLAKTSGRSKGERDRQGDGEGVEKLGITQGVPRLWEKNEKHNKKAPTETRGIVMRRLQTSCCRRRSDGGGKAAVIGGLAGKKGVEQILGTSLSRPTEKTIKERGIEVGLWADAALITNLYQTKKSREDAAPEGNTPGAQLKLGIPEVADDAQPNVEGLSRKPIYEHRISREAFLGGKENSRKASGREGGGVKPSSESRRKVTATVAALEKGVVDKNRSTSRSSCIEKGWKVR